MIPQKRPLRNTHSAVSTCFKSVFNPLLAGILNIMIAEMDQQSFGMAQRQAGPVNFFIKGTRSKAFSEGKYGQQCRPWKLIPKLGVYRGMISGPSNRSKPRLAIAAWMFVDMTFDPKRVAGVERMAEKTFLAAI